mmetsp:Transcript_1131/g.3880  ORF Transcript_1131/g.3880 Transcript_1131/m.3880 type:complete len:145 (-) Transcript_1131:3708-4142(-)
MLGFRKRGDSIEHQSIEGAHICIFLPSQLLSALEVAIHSKIECVYGLYLSNELNSRCTVWKFAHPNTTRILHAMDLHDMIRKMEQQHAEMKQNQIDFRKQCTKWNSNLQRARASHESLEKLAQEIDDRNGVSTRQQRRMRRRTM